ncbi:MAG: hypothetical protein ACRELB_10605 [Polyangiaceae bacterium]
MRKLLLTTVVLTAGCTAATQPQPGSTRGTGEPTAMTAQAVTTTTTTTTTGDPDGENPNGKLPRPRWVTPHGGDSGGGGGGGTGTGGATPGWQPLTNFASFIAGTSLLLTDGSVMVQDILSSDWWKLTPDATGNYVDGTWTQLASAPDGYQPLYFASAVLPDGRVIIEGGEYQALNPTWQTTGAIYDPRTDTWTTVAPPTGWYTIGDAQSIVLPDGRFYLADCCSTNAATLDPRSLTWTAFGSGKADINDEEGWTLLPSGDLLTVDANNVADLQHTELFKPRSGTWSSAGDTPDLLADLAADYSGSHELGPTLLRPDGTAFAVGATGHSAIYHTQSGRWTAGPDFPNVAGEGQLDTADGPAALLPNGHALVASSWGVFNWPLHMFDFDGRNLTEIATPPGGVWDSSYNTTLLVLPSGQILFTDFSNDVEIYTPPGKADREWAPSIDESCGLERLQPGQTYTLSGRQLNGLSQGSAYGDDAQQATNYPLVRITNRATGHVVYARTHDRTYAGVAPHARSSTSFDVPAGTEPGDSTLVVVANGIASDPVEVQVRGAVQRR